MNISVLRKHILGSHVAEYMKILLDDDEAAFKRQFSRFIKDRISVDSVSPYLIISSSSVSWILWVSSTYCLCLFYSSKEFTKRPIPTSEPNSVYSTSYALYLHVIPHENNLEMVLYSAQLYWSMATCAGGDE